jgi:hypothetical protein
MECLKCKRTFLKNERIVSMSGSIMGDEHTDTFYLCSVCQVYSVESCWDNFTGGDETIEVRGPLDKTQGEGRIAIIMRCERPWDKKCRCEVHWEYFNDTLD